MEQLRPPPSFAISANVFATSVPSLLFRLDLAAAALCPLCYVPSVQERPRRNNNRVTQSEATRRPAAGTAAVAGPAPLQRSVGQLQ